MPQWRAAEHIAGYLALPPLGRCLPWWWDATTPSGMPPPHPTPHLYPYHCSCLCHRSLADTHSRQLRLEAVEGGAKGADTIVPFGSTADLCALVASAGSTPSLFLAADPGEMSGVPELKHLVRTMGACKPSSLIPPPLSCPSP